MIEFAKWVQWERLYLGHDKKWYLKATFTNSPVFAETDEELLKRFRERGDELKTFFDKVSL